MAGRGTADAEIDALLGAGSAAALREIFQAELPARLARMRAAAAKSAASLLQREAHGLAGAAGLLGLEPLAQLARALEQAAPVPGATTLAERFAPVERLLVASLGRSAVAATPPCAEGNRDERAVLVSRHGAD